jgi:DNA-3-methyladenine glycosylase II
VSVAQPTSRGPTPNELRALAARDPALGRALRRLPSYPGFPAPADRRRSHYDALARAIVYQQITGKAAQTILRRVTALTPGPRFPSPPEMAALTDDALRGAGLSRGKTAAVRDLAQRVASGALSLQTLGRRADADVIEHLVQVRGIGVWSAQMFLLFRLGRLDVFAPGDLGLREGIRILDGLAERPGERAAEARAACWAPLRSVASWTLWRLVEDERSRA